MNLKKREGRGSKAFALHPLVGLGKALVNDFNLELHHAARWHIIGDERHKSLDDLIHVVEANVFHVAQLLAENEHRAPDEMLCRETEKSILLLWLLAFFVGKEYQIDNFVVELPCGGEVKFEVAASNLVFACMVHGKGDITN